MTQLLLVSSGVVRRGGVLGPDRNGDSMLAEHFGANHLTFLHLAFSHPPGSRLKLAIPEGSQERLLSGSLSPELMGEPAV